MGNTNVLISFWAGPHSSSAAVEKLLPFPYTYLCETALSIYAATKIKYRNRLNENHYMRIQLSKTVPDFSSLVGSKQIYPYNRSCFLKYGMHLI
jgi:hypothetical protein